MNTTERIQLDERLTAVQTAIRRGRAFLDTNHMGRRKIVYYNAKSGWAVTNNSGDFFGQNSFQVGLNDIIIV